MPRDSAPAKDQHELAPQSAFPAPRLRHHGPTVSAAGPHPTPPPGDRGTQLLLVGRLVGVTVWARQNGHSGASLTVSRKLVSRQTSRPPERPHSCGMVLPPGQRAGLTPRFIVGALQIQDEDEKEMRKA